MIRPEHEAKTLEDFELAVFDDPGVKFHTIAIRGRGTRERQEFGDDLSRAIDYARSDQRAVIYALAQSGRFIVLDTKRLEFWLERHTNRAPRRIFRLRGKAARTES